MLHLIRSGIELWQSGVVVLGQSDPEHKNAASVWTPLTKGRFMDLDFTLWGTGIWNATMSSRQGTTEKIPLVCNCWDGLLSKPSGRRGKYIEREQKTQSYIGS
jgi:hypothetical protein